MSAVLPTPAAPQARPQAATLITPEFLHNPYPSYHALRARGPLHWSDEYFGGAWLLTQHDDADLVLRDPRFSAQRTGGWVTDREDTHGDLAPFQRLFARALLFLDGPDHSRLRKVMNLGFRPEVITQLVPHIEHTVAELLDAVADAPSFDFIARVARPLPVRVVSLLLGIPEQAQPAALMAWSEDLAHFVGAAQPSHDQARRAQVSLLAMCRYLEQLLAHKRQHPGDDLTTRLVQAEAAGQIDGGAELLAQCAMLLFAGHETTRHLLGSGLHALLTRPALWQRLQTQPELLPATVRELLRYESPVQYTGRRVTTDLVLHGQLLRRGDLVLPLIGAANRDPARYTHPDELDIARRDGPSLAFGVGPHVCIGAALTRIEAETLLRQLLTRMPDLQCVNPQAEWVQDPLYRGLVTLPVRRAGTAAQPA
jgi:cytochrome P450